MELRPVYNHARNKDTPDRPPSPAVSHPVTAQLLSFAERLRLIKSTFAPDLAFLTANADRVRIASPREGASLVQDRSRDSAAQQTGSTGAIDRFRQRVEKERELTQKNSRYYDQLGTGDMTRNEYFDYCFVFHTHPVDFGEPGFLTPNIATSVTSDPVKQSLLASPKTCQEGTAESEPLLQRSSVIITNERRSEHASLRHIYLTAGEMRNYLATVCNYRDVSNVLTAAQGHVGYSTADYPSAYSMEVHHRPHAAQSVLEDVALGPYMRKIIPKKVPAPDGPPSMPQGKVELELPKYTPSETQSPAAKESADEGRLLDPPLALVKDPMSGIFKFTSAGADTLPAFYGLKEFVEFLNSAGTGYIMDGLDFSLVIRETFLSCLRKAGVDLNEFVSSDQTKMLVKARLSEAACRSVANHTEYVCAADRNATSFEFLRRSENYCPPFLPFEIVAEQLKHGYQAAQEGRKVWRRYDGLSRELLVSLNPVNEGAARTARRVEDLYEDLEFASVFRDVDRIRLLNYIVGTHFDIRKLGRPCKCQDYKCKIYGEDPLKATITRVKAKDPAPTQCHCGDRRNSTLPGVLLGHFPLHQRQTQIQLRQKWASFRYLWNTEQPLDQIRDYFGEQVAFYFLWTGYFTDCLRVPAIAGLIVFITLQICSPPGPIESPWVAAMIVGFALYISWWSYAFASNWRNLERYWQLKWGMEAERMAHKQEHPTALFDYYVVDALNPRKLTKFYLPAKRKARDVISGVLTLVTIAIIVGCVAAIYASQGAIGQLAGPYSFIKPYAPQVVSTVQAAQIVLFDYIWCSTVRWQTRFENHRYQSDFERSRISKMFLFRFANNFYALLYIAFFKNYWEPCAPMEEGGCFGYFQIQLFILYLFFYGFNIMELGIPLVSFWSKPRTLLDSHRSHDFVEIQSMQVPYEPEQVVEDYMEIVIQYCAVVLFSLALPITPLCAYLQNLLEIRSDAYKITLIQQRAFPLPAPRGLHTYNDIVQLIGLVAAPFNVALCVFLIPFGEAIVPLQSKMLFFILAEHILLFIRSYALLSRQSYDPKPETMRDTMRVAAHDILWGHRNLLTYTQKHEEDTVSMEGRRGGRRHTAPSHAIDL